MAKQKAKAIFGIVIGLLIVAVLVANLLPIALGQLNSGENVTLNQDVGTEYEVETDVLNSTVTAVTDATNATVELKDVESGTTVSNTVSVGSTTTYTLEGQDVNVTVNSASSGTPGNASVTYEYATSYGWSAGTAALYGIIGILLIVVVIAPVAGWAMDAMG